MLTIVFDLDGTLVDTAPDLIDTLNFILARQGLPAVPYDDARPMIGGGARGMIERALAAEARDCTPRRRRPALSLLSSRITPSISPTARVPSRMSKPRSTVWPSAGHRLAVCTNKLEWLSKRLLRHA